MKKWIGAALVAAAALVTVPTAGAADLFSATCQVGGSSSFTATKSGIYAWTWRTGTTVNGYGSRYVAAGTPVTESTPGGVDSSSKFGVVGSKSRSYSYVTCNN